MSHSIPAQKHEEPFSDQPLEQTVAAGPWTLPQQRLLAILQHPEYRNASVTEICRLAGFSSRVPWYHALKDEYFAKVVETLGITLTRHDRKIPDLRSVHAQQQLLAVLQHPENRKKPIKEICQLAGFASKVAWMNAIKDELFVAKVEALGVSIRKSHLASHLEVEPATHIEEELAKDVWDIRRFKSEYPKHRAPAQYVIDFSWISNLALREQVKCYFRQRITRWGAATFKRNLAHLKTVLVLLPPDVPIGTLQRSHIETVLPTLSQLSPNQACRGLREARIMCEYMATSPAWTGPRPPRFLIWKEDIPPRPEALPRPIPPDVLDQLDPMLKLAEKAMQQGQEPGILAPMLWDVLLILRHTGMRFEDLAHLTTPDGQGRKGCLDQDSEGYWWICIDHTNTKMAREHRIPTREADGVIAAIRRQQERIKSFPDHFEAHYLFRTEKGIIMSGQIQEAWKCLAAHLTHDEQPYVLTGHQFRHTLATDMIEQGVDIYTVKEFLGHKTLAMTERYVKVYLTSLKAKYDAYRLKKQQTSAFEMMSQVQVVQPEGDVEGGWVENKVGKLYVSPLASRYRQLYTSTHARWLS